MVTQAQRDEVVEEAVVKFSFSVPVGAAGDNRLSGLHDRFNILMAVNKYPAFHTARVFAVSVFHCNSCECACVLFVCRMVVSVMPFVDLSYLSKPGSLANLVSQCRSVVFQSARVPLLASGLDASSGGGSEFTLSLNFALVRAAPARVCVNLCL